MMNYDNYGEIINGKDTFKTIAKDLMENKNVIIGWTDQIFDHRDIMFVYGVKKYGSIQRGLRENYLYVSIMDFTSMGFKIDLGEDNRKHNGYIKEKLKLKDNECDEKICELINGVIYEIDSIYADNNE